MSIKRDVLARAAPKNTDNFSPVSVATLRNACRICDMTITRADFPFSSLYVVAAGKLTKLWIRYYFGTIQYAAISI